MFFAKQDIGHLQKPPRFRGRYDSLVLFDSGEVECGARAGSSTFDERLKELSAKGDDLERLNAIVDFEVFRPNLVRAVPRSDGSKGGRPAFDHVLMLKVLILQAAHGLSDERTE